MRCVFVLSKPVSVFYSKKRAVAKFVTVFRGGDKPWFRPYLGKNFSDAGDAHGTIPRLRKVFPDEALASAIR